MIDSRQPAAQLAQPAAYELQTPAANTGSSAPSIQVDYADAEYNTTQVQVSSTVVDISVPAILLKRKLYAAIWTNASSAIENWVLLKITFYLHNSPVGTLPLSVGVTTSGTATTLTRILPSAINAGGYPEVDAVILTLDNPAAWSAVNGFLHPLYLKAQFDRITVDVVQQLNTTNLKIYFACLSHAA